MHDDKRIYDDRDIQEKRQAIILYYQGESARLEEQSRDIFVLSRKCLAWVETTRKMAPAGVEYVYGVVEKAKAEHAERLTRDALVNAKAEALREMASEGLTGWRLG